MSGTSLTALLFLISTIFDLYIFVLIIRLILAWVGTDYTYPLTSLVVKLTGPIIRPLRKILPDIAGIELATIVVILLLEFIKFFIIVLLSFGFPNLLGILILAPVDFIKSTLEIFFYAILLQAIVSWVQPSAPIALVLNKITYPVLRPFQRLIPPVAGFDLSPIPALIILQLIIIALINPLIAFGLGVAVI